MNKAEDKKPFSTTAAAIVFAAAMTSILAVSAVSSTLMYQAGYAYGRSQSSSQANDCGNASNAFNVLCQNCDSQIEGSGNAMNLLCEQVAVETPEPEPETTQLEIEKIVSCSFTGPILECPAPSQFTMNIEGINPSRTSVPGSVEPTIVTLEPGPYQVTEETPQTLPLGLFLIETSFSDDCFGTINAGETRTCVYANSYADSPPIP